MTGIDTELAHITVPGVGQAITVLPVIPEDAPYLVREGIARQRIAATTGTCPCGAHVDFHAAVEHGVNVAEAHHNRRCPGQPDRLGRAVRRWVR